MDLVKEFFTLFKPLRRAYGLYIPGKVHDSNGKLGGKAITKREKLTRELIEEHLNGSAKDGITIGAIPIRDDNCAHFGAIDIDLYKDKIDKAALVKLVRSRKFPLVAVTSKSGGMHLYAFFSEPVPCGIIQSYLTKFADALGYPGVEIFPKQNELRNDEEVGNWINLPYQGALHPDTRVSDRHGFDDDGDVIPRLESWIAYAKSHVVTQEQLEAVKLPDQGAPFSDGPPCLQHLASSGVSDMRNVVLFNMGVYARMKFPTDWQGQMYEYNKDFDPTLSGKEVQAVVNSLDKKNGYFYQCQTQPLCTFCHRNKCLSRQFGIGDAASANQRIEFGPIIKQVVVDDDGKETDDNPLYFWTLNGKQLTFTMGEIQTQRQFRLIVSERLDIIPVMLKDATWLAMVNDLMNDNMETVEAPFETGVYGQFIAMMYDFIDKRDRAEDLGDLFSGATLVDLDKQRAYFRWQDLKAYLANERHTNLPQKVQWSTMRKYADALSLTKNVQGRTLRYWDVAYNVEEAQVHIRRAEQEF